MSTLAAGARVLVTRPTQQAANLSQLIRQEGGEPVLFPVLEIKALDPVINHEQVMAAIQRHHWVIFISVNAVRFACLDKCQSLSVQKSVRVAAVGLATAAALTARHWPVHLLPNSGFNSEALLAMPDLQQVENQRVLIIRGQGGRDKLADTLRQRGAKVGYLEVYRRTKPLLSNAIIEQALVSQQLNAIVITSGQALLNLLDLAGENTAKVLKSIPLVVISHRIKIKAEKLGFSRIGVANKPKDAAIVKTIKALLNGE